MTSCRATMLASSAFLAAISGSANAQTPPAPVEGAQTSADDQSAGVQDIVVTAQRRSESLQRVAAPIVAVTGDQLLANGVTTAADLSKLTPALTITPSIGGYTQVNIRGVGTFSANSYAEQAVAINLDGVYLARPASISGLYYDIDRVEVLKGPQGTLYGRNATGGAVNIIPKRPVFEDGGEINLEMGNYKEIKAEAAINLALSSTVAFRLAGQTVSHDGYLSDGYDDEKGQALRGQLLFKPSNDFSILFAADYYRQYGMGDESVPVPFVDPNNKWLGPSDPRVNARLAAAGLPLVNNDGYVNNHYWGASATIEWRTSLGTLTVIPAYRRTKLDFLTYPAFPLADQENAKQTSLEARFATDESKPLRAVLGAYYFRETNDSLLSFNLGPTYGIQDLPILTTNSYAAFGQATYDLTHRLRLVGGIRYTKERKRQDGTRTGPLPDVPADLYPVVCSAPATIDLSNLACVAPVSGRDSFSKVTWKAGVEFDLAPASLLYANVATGFKAGGFYASLAPNTYGPERLTAYTIGSKNRLFGNILQINIEGFYWDYRDQQISFSNPVLPSGVSVITQNVGQSRIYGADVDLVFSPSPRDQISANIQYLNGKYTDFRYQQTSLLGSPLTACAVSGPESGFYSIDCSGHRMIQTPRWSGNVTYNRRFDLGNGGTILAMASVRFSGARNLDTSYLPGLTQDAYHVENLSLGYQTPDHALTFTAFVNNVGNQVVSVFGQPQSILGYASNFLEPPRTYGVRIGAKF